MEHHQNHNQHNNQSNSNAHQNADWDKHHHNKNKKHKDHFQYALIAIIVSITVALIAFKTADNSITAFAVSNFDKTPSLNLPEFKDFNSLQSLAAGNYYVDSDGIVYWIDDASNPVVAKVKNLDDSQKNRQIYIDGNGNIGYTLK